MYFGVGKLFSYTGTFPGKEGGMQVLAGLAQFSQTVRTVLRTLLGGKASQKKS